MGGYLTAIEQEIDLRATLADKTFGSLGSANRQPLETLYLGGGTPSLLPTDRLASLI
jgi:coproporphyrinogen III oxidase-like Fe-S oxidoreductase